MTLFLEEVPVINLEMTKGGTMISSLVDELAAGRQAVRREANRNEIIDSFFIKCPFLVE
jgi:hypothetical protein